MTEIVIPDGVTYIGSRAFKDSAYLTTLTIPSSVKAIGYSAFRECVNLKDITMQEGVEDIRNGAFDGCNAPPSLVIPESVTSIGAYAFYATQSSCNVRFQNTMEQVLSIPNAPWGISVNTILHCSNGDLYVKTRNINELSDVCHFIFKNDKPTDRGSVLEPNSIGMNENLF